jgi:2-oxoglutarate ferredoxin oxidoreductase subunit alpha
VGSGPRVTAALGGTLLVNEDAFTAKDLQKAGYATNPIEDASLKKYRLIKVPLLYLSARATRRNGRPPHGDDRRSMNER